MEEELIELLDECYVPFDKICDKAKCLLISYAFNHNNLCNYYEYMEELYDIKSPIEQIFYVAYILYCSLIRDNKSIKNILLNNIIPQRVITINDKTYVVDFMIDVSDYFIDNKNDKLRYVIELDGFDYHSNKQQMNYDYERENDLKIAGYKVIRFTGSQLFNTPYRCVNNLIKIILKDIEMEK